MRGSPNYFCHGTLDPTRRCVSNKFRPRRRGLPKTVGPRRKGISTTVGPRQSCVSENVVPRYNGHVESLLFLQGTTHETQKPHKFENHRSLLEGWILTPSRVWTCRNTFPTRPPLVFGIPPTVLDTSKSLRRGPVSFCHVETRILEESQKLVKPIRFTCCISCGFRRV